MTKKRVLIIISSIILVVVAAVAGFIGYLQFNAFIFKPLSESTLSTYVDDAGLDLLTHEIGDIYIGNLPLSEVDKEANRIFRDQYFSGNDESGNINSGRLYLSDKVAKINYNSGPFLVPVTHHVDYTIEDGIITMTLTPISYGDNNFVLPDFINDLLFGSIFKERLSIKMDLTTYNPSDLFIFQDANLLDKGVEFRMKLQLPNIDHLIEKVIKDLDPDFVELYKNGTDTQKKVVQLLEDFNKGQEGLATTLFEDFLDQADLIGQILPLVKPDTLKEIYDEYALIDSKVSQSLVLDRRTKLIGDTVFVYGQSILEGLEALSAEGNLILSQGYPFDYKHMETITLDRIVEMYGIEIPDEIRSKMTMTYTGEDVYVVYHSEEEPIIVMNLKGYKTISEKAFQETYNIPLPEIGELTKNPQVYDDIVNELEAYYGEKIFIRYMKNDSEQAYVIASLEGSYQTYKLVALKRVKGIFKVYAEGFETALELNHMYPDFNMNLVTRMNEGTKMLTLNTKTKNNLIEGLKEQGYMGSEEEMVYCSYDGVRYIFMELTTGEEYIYTIYRGTFLEKIYTIDKALEKFDDIDPMIILQAKPE